VIGKEETLVHIDPCVVFGTGYHPTTRSCLRALWEIYQKERPGKVLDLGTGSGILALATAKWGAKKVLAIDCNELAVETALRNISLNGEWEHIEVRQGKAEDFVEEEAELLCANLHLRVIDSLLRKEALFKKRWLILSGLFQRDGQEVANRLEQGAVTIIQRIEEKNWITLTGFNQNAPKS
jgi:ribosomal protein L11 methyltransferase